MREAKIEQGKACKFGLLFDSFKKTMALPNAAEKTTQT
jgi:hypothetical protein